ncbi:MAG: anthranilate phosphoribosyltransferase [Planctomycetia bacterium]|nr:MAG: anthranilate phosphoribosyltransferase [Planctomycetia bacterium]
MTQSLLGRVSAGENLAQDQMAAAVEVIVQGAWSEGEIGVFLTALAAKGETEAELAGAAAALRRHMTPIRSKRTGLLDTCGTGGDRSRTFNISTAAALVVAAAGVPVAKHGNRRITSSSGSADVLAALGVNVEATVAQVEACLDEVGIGFCFAPLHHPGVKRVAAVRRKLGVPTIFNLLGPLCNPASAPYQLLGVSKPQHRLLLARALALLGTTRALVVWGEDGLDEVTLSAATRVTQVQEGQLVEHRWTPEEFGIARAPRDELVVEGPQESAAMIRSVLAGKPGPARDIVVLNAAAALYVAAAAADLRQAAGLAAAAIDSGATGRLLAQLSETSRRG